MIKKKEKEEKDLKQKSEKQKSSTKKVSTSKPVKKSTAKQKIKKASIEKTIRRRTKVKTFPEKVSVETSKAEQLKEKIKVEFTGSITPQEVANYVNKPVSEVITALMRLGVIASATQSITDQDTVILLFNELGYDIELINIGETVVEEKEVIKKFVEIEKKEEKEKQEAQSPSLKDVKKEILPPGSYIKKVPVVTVMGHVDHGKTTLLDTIRKTNVASKEYGFITQHIGAYKVRISHGDITFIDTPGHEAFSSIRSRGASITDIVVLVVAGDEGVMPQTLEAISHAKMANVPIIVAVNKVDLANFNGQKVRQQLSDHGLVAHDWGGNVEFIDISARNNINIDKLLDTILLQAEIMDLKARVDTPAEGTVIETKLDTKMGLVATIILAKGILKNGDTFVCGFSYGKVRAIISDSGQRLSELKPGEPAEILGFQVLPQAGDIFRVVEDEKEAKKIIEKEKEKSNVGQVRKKLSFQDILASKSKVLNLIIKSDTQGSSEAIKKLIESLTTQLKEKPDAPEVKIVYSGVGEISESDVLLASAGNSVIIGFNIRPTVQALKVAKHERIEIRTYRIIYDLIDDIKKILSGMETKVEREEFLGRARIKKVFDISKLGKIAGCVVEEGKIVRNARVRLLRDNVIVSETKISSLKRFKEDVKEVEKGYECGIGLENLNDIKENDVIESYQIVKE